MNHQIVYSAVRKKADTTPPNKIIGNVEMAAIIGIILKQNNIIMDLEGVDEPDKIKTRFLETVKVEELSEKDKIMYEMVEKYKPLDLLNEKMEDLFILIKNEF